jgi:hypothetical protein
MSKGHTNLWISGLHASTIDVPLPRVINTTLPPLAVSDKKDIMLMNDDGTTLHRSSPILDHQQSSQLWANATGATIHVHTTDPLVSLFSLLVSLSNRSDDLPIAGNALRVDPE